MKKKLIGLMLTLAIIVSMSSAIFADSHDKPKASSIFPPFDIMMLNK